jgi:hypothetical protein
MPLFNVPQYIDVEDKIAGPFTGKQLLWMFGMGATLLVLWNMLEQVTFYIMVIPVAALFGAFAFYRPYNQTLLNFIISAVGFIFRPKLYIWERTMPKVVKKQSARESKAKETIQLKKKLSAEDIQALAKTLDSEGRERGERIMEIIKSNQKK